MKRRSTVPSTSTRSKARKGRVAGAQSPALLPSTEQPVERSSADDKYAHLSVYDPATKEIVAADGTRTPKAAAMAAAVPEPSAGNAVTDLRRLPTPLAMLDWLYACEPADEATIRGLADVAKCTIAELEHRRRDFLPTPESCPFDVASNPALARRRRCDICPYWRLTDDTPF